MPSQLGLFYVCPPKKTGIEQFSAAIVPKETISGGIGLNDFDPARIQAVVRTRILMHRSSRFLKPVPHWLVALGLLIALWTPLQSAPETSKAGADPEAHEALLAIVEREKTLQHLDEMAQMGRNTQKEFESTAAGILEDYSCWVEQHPDAILGRILYGKLLVKLDMKEKAHQQFLAANKIDPHVAVVNQQLGNHAAEKGDYSEAFFHLRKACFLDPDAAPYHYQLGELIYTYKNPLVLNRDLSISEAEELMMSSFQKATELAPDVRDFAMRHAEAYFDLLNPDWNEALAKWDHLLESTDNLFERDVIRLRKAQVLAKLKRFLEARELAESVTQEALQEARESILAGLP